jgi:hypothetical protein
MENLINNRYEDALGELKDFFKGFFNEILDPYRRERGGTWNHIGIGQSLEHAFNQVLYLKTSSLSSKDRSDYLRQTSPDDVARKFCLYVNEEVASFFLEKREVAFVPDLLEYSYLISEKMQSLALKVINN